LIFAAKFQAKAYNFIKYVRDLRRLVIKVRFTFSYFLAASLHKRRRNSHSEIKMSDNKKPI